MNLWCLSTSNKLCVMRYIGLTFIHHNSLQT